jgi:hypothetical protein
VHMSHSSTDTSIIIKANGDREPFVRDKLLRSLRRSGASDDVAERITTRIEQSITSGDRTVDIYRRAFRELRDTAPVPAVAARYSVKRALLELGPSGYPFEHFVSELFREMGYTVETGIEVMGVCVPHEVDVVAENEHELLMGEAKYHNAAGLVSDVKVALYVDARFQDIERRRVGEGETRRVTRLLVTNTKFSTQAIAYGACRQMRLIGWDYPEQGNLEDLIETYKMHPISCLSSLSTAQKRRLMDAGVVRCKQLLHENAVRDVLGLSESDTHRVHDELAQLCTERVAAITQ